MTPSSSETQGAASQARRSPPVVGTQSPSTGKWAVSTRSVGEVLTTDIRGDGLRVLVFSTPTDRTTGEIEARLVGLADSALEAAGHDVGPRPVPGLLHHCLLAAIDLVGDLEHATRAPAGAVAFYGSGREVGFGCVGGREPEWATRSDGVEIPWVSVGGELNKP